MVKRNKPSNQESVKPTTKTTGRTRVAEQWGSEAALSAIFNIVGTGILVIDSETQTILEVNQTAAEMVGRTKEKIVGQICHSFICPAEVGKCPIKDLGQSIDNSERKIICADGQRKDILKNVSAVLIQGRKCYLESFIDITDRKRAEDSLKTLSARQEAILSAVPDIIVEVDNNKVYTWANQEARNFFGEDLIGKEASLYFEGEQDTYDIVQPLFNGDENMLYLESWQRRKDGQPRLLAWWCRILRDGSGKILGALSTAQDITERKQAGDTLRESEERYRLLATNSEDVIWTLDTQFRFTYISPAIYKLRGLTPEEAIQESLADTLTPDSLQRVNEMIETRLPDLETGSPVSARLDIEQYRKDRSRVWVEIAVKTMTDNAGALTGFVGISRDITERKLAEAALRESNEKYRLVVENAQEAIFIAVDGIIKFANRRTVEITGYSQMELISKPFTEFVHPEDRQMVARQYSQRLNGIGVPNLYSFRVVHKSGDIKWVEPSGAVITWEGMPATLHFVSDITDRRRLEEEQQRVAKLESVGLLAGGIAHDFNNILTSILGNISLAGTEATPGSELQNSLEQAEKALLRAKGLTKQLLTFSRGGAPITKLASLTELLMDTAGFALHGSNVKCHFSIPADLWQAEIDAGQVSQVIHNLVINAQQAMPTGGTIKLSAENMALSETLSLGKGLPLKAGNYVRIAVTDRGSGIPSDQLDRVFDPFFSTKQKGSGLGLATSFSIARQHGGHLSVESQLGSGSTFYLYLPASTETVALKPEREEPVKPACKAKILVMDDEQGVREVAGRMLNHIGYKNVEFASDGAAAINLYKAALKSGQPFSAVILDLTIAGGMGGIETVSRLLRVDPGVRAIVSSGYADGSVMAEYKEYGFRGMVAKPYTLGELGKALHDVMG